MMYVNDPEPIIMNMLYLHPLDIFLYRLHSLCEPKVVNIDQDLCLEDMPPKRSGGLLPVFLLIFANYGNFLSGVPCIFSRFSGLWDI